MDRGYLDFRRLFQMHQAGAFFVIRANSLEAENTALADLACVSPASDGDNLYFEGCNVHVRNGNGTTNTHNGYGNPIVGYDEADQSGLVRCSNGVDDEVACEDASEIWDRNQKTGSHYLMIGRGHSYAQFGGLVSGRRHFVNGPEASVSGGFENTASGLQSSISGGEFNLAGGGSSVSGGFLREAPDPNNWAAGDLLEAN
jgi:hypothetical protein